jgi:hypothetical protein
MTATATKLRLREPVGTYQIDSHADVLFPNAPDDVAAEAVRAEVNRAAGVAIVRTRRERSDLREARKNAKDLIKLLKNIERDAAKLKWLPAGDVSAVAAELSEGFAATDATSLVVEPLVNILENIDGLRSWTTGLQARVRIAPAQPSHSDPLARQFIEAMATAHRAWRGTEPPSGRTGRFVNLLEAAWADIGFPDPPPTIELKEWLGAKVEDRAKALRVLTTKSSGQPL